MKRKRFLLKFGVGIISMIFCSNIFAQIELSDFKHPSFGEENGHLEVTAEGHVHNAKRNRGLGFLLQSIIFRIFIGTLSFFNQNAFNI